MFALMTILLGAIYPGLVTLVGQLAFPHQANGSIIEQTGKNIGSELIGQNFQKPGYFWSRPSATSPVPYNSGASTGSNYGPMNPALLDEINQRISALHAVDSTNKTPIPVDLVTSSGSGLDPHISVASAEYQVNRIAKVRGVSASVIRQFVARSVEHRQFGFLGEPRVNVLLLNLTLDKEIPLQSQ